MLNYKRFTFNYRHSVFYCISKYYLSGARHTWATLAFHAGMSIGIISKALGHFSIKVTETYLKPFENEKVDAANEELIISVAGYNEKKVA